MDNSPNQMFSLIIQQHKDIFLVLAGTSFVQIKRWYTMIRAFAVCRQYLGPVESKTTNKPAHQKRVLIT